MWEWQTFVLSLHGISIIQKQMITALAASFHGIFTIDRGRWEGQTLAPSITGRQGL